MRILTMMSNSIFSPQDSFLSLPPLSTLSQFQDCIPRCLSMLREAKNYWEKKFNRIQTSSRKAEKRLSPFLHSWVFLRPPSAVVTDTSPEKLISSSVWSKFQKKIIWDRNRNLGTPKQDSSPDKLILSSVWSKFQLKRKSVEITTEIWECPNRTALLKSWFYPQSLKKIIWDRDRNLGTP